MAQCAVPRAQGQFGTACEPSSVSHSMLQELKGGARFATCMVHFVLATISCVHVHLSHRKWVGDLSQRMIGPSSVLRTKVTACLADTCDELAQWKLEASP
eukprot:1338369-Pyramimonas_sp.AAC.1